MVRRDPTSRSLTRTERHPREAAGDGNGNRAVVRRAVSELTITIHPPTVPLPTRRQPAHVIRAIVLTRLLWAIGVALHRASNGKRRKRDATGHRHWATAAAAPIRRCG